MSGICLRLSEHPISINLCLARVRATLIRLQSDSRRPALPWALDRTSDMMMQGLSRPWYLSTVSASISSFVDAEWEEEVSEDTDLSLVGSTGSMVAVPRRKAAEACLWSKAT